MTNTESNPFVKKMLTIYGLAYHASTTKQKRTKHAAWTHVFKTSLLVPKIGPYKEIEDYLETSVETQLQKVEDKVLEKFENIFKNVCPCRPDDTHGATKRRDALGKVVEGAKATLNAEVRAELLEYGLGLL